MARWNTLTTEIDGVLQLSALGDDATVENVTTEQTQTLQTEKQALTDSRRSASCLRTIVNRWRGSSLWSVKNIKSVKDLMDVEQEFTKAARLATCMDEFGAVRQDERYGLGVQWG